MKKINYYVIGGQYEGYNYGGAATLLGAKRLARRNQEYWDNWQGWHKPCIYRAEDVEIVKSYGRICTPDGWDIRVTKPGARPWVWRYDHWERVDRE